MTVTQFPEIGKSRRIFCSLHEHTPPFLSPFPPFPPLRSLCLAASASLSHGLTSPCNGRRASGCVPVGALRRRARGRSLLILLRRPRPRPSAPAAAGGVRARAPADRQAGHPGGYADANPSPAEGEARAGGHAGGSYGARGGAADPHRAGGARARDARRGAPRRGPRARRGWRGGGRLPRPPPLPLHPVLQAPRAARPQGLARRRGRVAVHLRLRRVPLRAIPDPGQPPIAHLPGLLV